MRIAGSLGHLTSLGIRDPAISLLGISRHFSWLFASVPVTRLLGGFRGAPLARERASPGHVAGSWGLAGALVPSSRHVEAEATFGWLDLSLSTFELSRGRTSRGCGRGLSLRRSPWVGRKRRRRRRSPRPEGPPAATHGSSLCRLQVCRRGPTPGTPWTRWTAVPRRRKMLCRPPAWRNPPLSCLFSTAPPPPCPSWGCPRHRCHPRHPSPPASASPLLHPASTTSISCPRRLDCPPTWPCHPRGLSPRPCTSTLPSSPHPTRPWVLHRTPTARPWPPTTTAGEMGQKGRVGVPNLGVGGYADPTTCASYAAGSSARHLPL